MKVRLGDVATYINGYAFKPSDWSTVGAPIIRIQDLTGNSYKQNRYNGDYEKRYEISSGDILISWSASLGVYIWAGEKAVLNQHIFKVVFDKINVNKNFFIHQVKSILEKASTSAHGATMKHLTRPTFNSLPFYLPDINTQNKIAMVLDNLESTISNKAKVLSLLDQLVKSRFMEMFGDPVAKDHSINCSTLSSICKLKAGKFIKSSDILQNHFQETYPCFGGNGIRGYVTKYNNDGSFPIIGRQGALCGNVQFAKGKFYATEHAIVVTPSKAISSKWLYHVLLNLKLNRYATGAAQPGLSVEKLGQLTIDIPPLPLQQQFAAFVEKVDKSKFIVGNRLAGRLYRNLLTKLSLSEADYD